MQPKNKLCIYTIISININYLTKFTSQLSIFTILLQESHFWVLMALTLPASLKVNVFEGWASHVYHTVGPFWVLQNDL